MGIEFEGRSHVVDFRSKTDFTMRDHHGKIIESKGMKKADLDQIGRDFDKFNPKKSAPPSKKADVVKALAAAAATAALLALA